MKVAILVGPFELCDFSGNNHSLKTSFISLIQKTLEVGPKRWTSFFTGNTPFGTPAVFLAFFLIFGWPNTAHSMVRASH